MDIDECEDEEVCELESQVCANMQSVQGTSSAQGFKCFCTDLDCFEEFCNSSKYHCSANPSNFVCITG